MKYLILTLTLLSVSVTSFASNESKMKDECLEISGKAVSFLRAKYRGEYLSSVERSIDATTGNQVKAEFLKEIAREVYDQPKGKLPEEWRHDFRKTESVYYSKCMKYY